MNLIRDGDVAPSIAAAQAFTGVDMLMGIGGTPEGVISAAAIKCLGGAHPGQALAAERRGAAGARRRRLRRRPGAHAPTTSSPARTSSSPRPASRAARSCAACASAPPGAETESIVMRSRSGTVRRIAAYHPSTKVRELMKGDRERWSAHDELHETAQELVADDQRHPRRRRELRDDREALRLDRRSSRPRRTGAPTATCSSRRPGSSESVSGVILYDETIRQSSRRRHAVPEAARRQGDHPRDQGRHGREARSPARRARRSPRASTGCASGSQEYRGARRPLREVARRDHDRRRDPDRVLHRGERARARPLRGAVPGAGPRPDRRARGADGRRQRHRDAATARPSARCTRSSTSSTTSGSTSRGCC